MRNLEIQDFRTILLMKIANNLNIYIVIVLTLRPVDVRRPLAGMKRQKIVVDHIDFSIRIDTSELILHTCDDTTVVG